MSRTKMVVAAGWTIAVNPNFGRYELKVVHFADGVSVEVSVRNLAYEHLKELSKIFREAATEVKKNENTMYG